MARRTGPLARVNLFRLGITVALVVTAILAFTLQAGVFRYLFRGVLVVAAILLFGSYLLEWWLKRMRNRKSG